MIPFATQQEAYATLRSMCFVDFLNTVVNDVRRTTLLTLYTLYEDLLHTNPASSANHQVWEGGLADHLADMCRFGKIMYDADMGIHECDPGYTWDEFVTAVFCHDAEKFVVYGPKDDWRCAPFHAMAADAADKVAKEGIKWRVLGHWQRTFGLRLNEAELNAVKYTHGEGSDYRPDARVMGPLAAAVGNADRWSARIHFNHGQGLG